jgi:predicted PhzF superfamily epimerase YddE/YHI9
MFHPMQNRRPLMQRRCITVDVFTDRAFGGIERVVGRSRHRSATVAAAALLADLASERDCELKLRIGQGVDMNRPSLLLTRVVKQNGAMVSAHVGGACVPMMEGTFRPAGEG